VGTRKFRVSYLIPHTPHIFGENMPQLQGKANQAHLSLSKYLAMLIKKDIDKQWPEGYFDLYGSWQGEVIQRPDQGKIEERDVLLWRV
jgi:hypothetical protein